MRPDDDDIFQKLKDRYDDYDGDSDAWRRDAEKEYGEDCDVEAICDEVEDVIDQERDFYGDEKEDFSDPDNPAGYRD